MDQLAKYDPYTIKQIEFYIEKKTKYTTLKSIIVSLVILIITIVVSWEYLQNIWVSRSKLDILSSDQKLSQSTFTQSYVCIISRNYSIKAPNITFSNLNKYTNAVVKNFVPTNKFNQVNQILAVSKGRDFYCYDIAGSIVNNNLILQLNIAKNSSEIDIVLKTYKLMELTKDQGPSLIQINPIFDGAKTITFLMKKIRSIIYDSLLINYQPQIIYGFRNQYRFLQQTLASTAPQYIIQFTSEDYRDNQLTQQINIKRRNIGQILGKFFSWLTIFILLFSYLIAPLVQFNFRLQLCKNIYNHKYLEKLQISIFTYFKYIIAGIKKGIFQEQILQQIFEKLQKDLDILGLVKKQHVMRRLIQENQQIETKRNDQTHQSKQDEQNIEKISNLLMATQSEDGSKIEMQKVQQQCDQNNQLNQIQIFNVSSDEKSNILSSILNALKSIDIGQTTISLITNKGQGYKNSYNTILSLLVFCSVLIFLIFAGAFNLKTTPEVRTILQGSDITQTKSIIINPQDIIFRGNKSLTDKFVLQLKTVNHNYDTIETIVLKNGSDCDAYVQNLNQTVGTGWNCLPYPINLKNNGKNQKKSLFFRFAFPVGVLPITSAKMEITYKQTNLINNKFAQNIIRIKQSFSNSQTKQYDLRLIVKQDGQQSQYVWTSYKYNLLDDTPQKGLSFEMTMDYQQLSMEQYSLWDIIDTSWGIFILVFTILLTKVTLYLNSKERQKITSDNQNQSRNDISQILSIEHNLKHKIFKKELKEISYFYKTKFQTPNSKIQ